MAADILGAAVPADRLDAVERLAGGNPFFAGRCSLAAGDRTVVPSGLRDVVMALLGWSSSRPRARQALGAASVFGVAIEHWLLAEVVDLESIELETALRETSETGTADPR